VYSRELFVCGRYDADWSVTCTEKCNWCYLNGVEGDHPEKFTGRYIVDFKSTNASSEAPKGIYPEYLIQCGVYMCAILEEHPERKYNGSLILNGSKNPSFNKDGTERPVFGTHFSFNAERDMQAAKLLAQLKELTYAGKQEIKNSK
jgi:hypothetical protein